MRGTSGSRVRRHHRPAGPPRSARLRQNRLLRGQGHTIADIVAKTGITRSSLYRHLPPREPESVTADHEAVDDNAT
ncbi:MAG: helix-turn-helix domain-containing protein [Actinomycetota bacterium]